MKKFKKLRTVAALMAALFMVQAIPFSAIAVGGEINGTIDHEAIIDQMHVDEAEKAEAQAIVAEEIGMRSENEKHYRLEDGSYVAAQYPTAVHYKDENGNWANIDNTLSFEESKSDEDFDGYTNNENSFSVKLANDAKDQLLRLDDGEGSVFMKLSESAAESSEISVENADNTAAAQSELTVEEQNEAAMSLDALTSKAEYADVMPGVDLEYTVMPDGVKEYIVVNEKLSDYEFSFELSLGDMYLRENDDNSISIMTADSEEKYIIPAPYMTDANDRYSEAVEYTVSDMGDGVYTLTVTADAGWIEDSETAFPVRIDPTVIKNERDNASIISAYVSETHSEVKFGTSPYLYVGNSVAFGTTRSFIKYSVTKRPKSSNVVISAKLKLYQHKFDRTTNPTIEIHTVNKSWAYNSTTWDNQPEYSDAIMDTVTVGDYSDGAFIELDVTDEIISYVDEPNSNFGIMLKASDESADSNTVCFASSNNQNNKPQLEIRYRIQKGLDDDYSYVKFDCGESGTAYVNTYNGDLNFVNKTLSAFDGAVELNHIYGTHILNSEEVYEKYTNNTEIITYGTGWMISAQEYIYPITESEYTGIANASTIPGYMYIYNNEYGTNVYLEQSKTNENEFVDRDRREYRLTVEKRNNVITGYTLTTPDGAVKTFNIVEIKLSDNDTRAKGYIEQCKLSNKKVITYDYRSSTQLNEIVCDDEFTTIQFGHSKINNTNIPILRSISFDGNTTRLEYSQTGSLESITDPLGRKTVFQYDENNRLISVDNNGEYSLTFTYDSRGRVGNVKYSSISSEQPSTVDFTYDRGVTSVNYSGVNAADTADDMILKYKFDENGSNTFVYAQNPQSGIYEKFAANGIKGIDCGAINDPDNNIAFSMNDDVLIGTNNFALNSNTRNTNVKLTSYYDDSHTGGHSYRMEYHKNGRVHVNFVTKSLTLQPGEHTFSAYVKCAALIDSTAKVSISVSDSWQAIDSTKAEIQLSNCVGDWKKLTVDFSTYSDVFETPDFEGVTDAAREFTLYISLGAETVGNAVLIDDVNIDGKLLSFPTEKNAVASSGFENSSNESNVRWETTNTSLNYIKATEEPENVAFGNQSVMIEGSTSREKSLHHIAYMNYTTDQTKYRLSGWGKASSLPLKEDGSNGFELFAYYIYYVATQTGTNANGEPVYTRGEMKTVSTAIPFDDQYDDWQYVSAELNAPNEDLADNQVIQIYSITIGTLYKNNIGNAYFDNVELTPVN